jgi:hypothetical protein
LEKNRWRLVAGLPDFSWYKVPKWEKYTKVPLNYQESQNITNGRNMFEMGI